MFLFKFLIFVVATINSIGASPHQEQKQLEWPGFLPLRGGHDFYISLDSMEQLEAFQECSSQPHYRLAVVTSQQLTDEIILALSFHDVENVWTSGRCNGSVTEQSFVWLSTDDATSIVDYTNWDEGQPFIEDSVDWVKSGITVKKEGRWELQKENEKYRALCQKRK